MSGFDYASWSAIFGPAGMPSEVVQRLNQAFVRVMADTAIQQFVSAAGIIPVSSTPAQLQAFLAEQITLWGRWSKEAGMQPT